MEINLANRKKEEGFDDKPNSVYLPLLGRSPAVSLLSDLQIKPQNYAQIVLDTNKAKSSYVTQFFNTNLGLKIRESSCSGFIPKLNKMGLSNLTVCLPDLETQTKTIQVNSVITDLSTQLEAYQRRLWNQPGNAKEIEKAIKTLGRENDYEQWIESLPFPIASILRAYYSDNNIEHKIEHLFHFFEGLSEFTCILMLSAFAFDNSLYKDISKEWTEKDPRNKEKYFNATFGT